MSHRVIVIPADDREEMLETTLESLAYPHLNRLLGERQKTEWVEMVRTPWLHSLLQPDYDPVARSGGKRYPSVCMVVDEEGRLKSLPPNLRAAVFYGGLIAGDAVIVAENGEDMFGLPASVTTEAVAAKALEAIAAALAH